MGTRVSIHRTACLSDLVRQRPLSASRGETRCDTYRNRHPCTFGAEDSRLETSARRLTRKRTPPARPRRPSASPQPHPHRDVVDERSARLAQGWSSAPEAPWIDRLGLREKPRPRRASASTYSEGRA